MSITVTDHTEKVLSGTNEAILRALEIIGGKAETHAKENLTRNQSVRTGNLRNSITHLVEDKEEKAAIIATNVLYGPFVELGTVKQKPKPYLRPAIEDHIEEYKKVLEDEIKRG